MSKTLIKHKYYSFELYEGRSILKLDWTEDSAGMTDEDFKDCLLKYAKLAEEHRIKKLWVVSERYRYKITPELMACLTILILIRPLSVDSPMVGL